MVSAFLAGGALADHPALWSGDGRITAGHLAVLRERSAAGPLELTLMDGALPGGRGGADWSWSRRDEAMADRVLAAAAGPGTLVVAGNAHTPVHPTELGVPLGAVLAARRPGVREIRIDYRSGRYYNLGPRRFAPRTGSRPAVAEAGSPQRKPHPRTPLRHRSGRAATALTAGWLLTAAGIWRSLRLMV